jgi:hypothetical protein
MNSIRHLPTTVATSTWTPAPRSCPARRFIAAAAMIPLVAAAVAGSAAAADPAGDVPGCTPITCAARYIGVPTDTLSASIVERARAGQGLGFDIVLDMLDRAEQRKLAAITGPAEFNVFEVRQIVRDHNDLRELILNYAAGSPIAPRMP